MGELDLTKLPYQPQVTILLYTAQRLSHTISRLKYDTTLYVRLILRLTGDSELVGKSISDMCYREYLHFDCKITRFFLFMQPFLRKNA